MVKRRREVTKSVSSSCESESSDVQMLGIERIDKVRNDKDSDNDVKEACEKINYRRWKLWWKYKR